MLAALAGIAILGERPGPAGLAGIGLLVAGVIILGLPARPGAARADPARVSLPARTTPAGPGQAPMGPASPSPPGSRAASARPATARPALVGLTAARPPNPHPARQPRSTGSALAPAAILFALVTGLFIAAYTLWDKIGVTTVGNPPLLQGYASLVGMALVLAPFTLANAGRTRLIWHSYRRQALGAGLLSPLAYVLVLVAMTFTSVAAVAPAREVSVLFGVVLGRKMLGEGGLARRLAGAAAIVAGIIAVTFG